MQQTLFSFHCEICVRKSLILKFYQKIQNKKQPAPQTQQKKPEPPEHTCPQIQVIINRMSDPRREPPFMRPAELFLRHDPGAFDRRRHRCRCVTLGTDAPAGSPPPDGACERRGVLTVRVHRKARGSKDLTLQCRREEADSNMKSTTQSLV